jgi:hypothetical protein
VVAVEPASYPAACACVRFHLESPHGTMMPPELV